MKKELNLTKGEKVIGVAIIAICIIAVISLLLNIFQWVNISSKNVEMRDMNFTIDNLTEQLIERENFSFYDVHDIFLLYSVLQGECNVCSITEKEHIIYTIFNRVYSNDFPRTISDVVNQPNQFQGFQPGKDYSLNYESLGIAYTLYMYYVNDNPYDWDDYNAEVLYFFNPERSTNTKFIDSIQNSRDLQYVGHHEFY